jgi:hypothetical protein
MFVVLAIATVALGVWITTAIGSAIERSKHRNW